MRFVGLDIHWRRTTMCILDRNGKQVKQATIRGGWEKVLAVVADLPKPIAVCYEASCGYGHLHDRLSKLADRVVVAHPGQLRLIFRAKRKHDRIDAGKLAKLLFLDEVPPVYVPSGQVRSWRQLIEYRRRVIDKRTRSKNGIRALLLSHGIVSPRGLWTGKGRQWLRQVALPELGGFQRDLLLEELEQFDRQVEGMTRLLNRMGRGHPGVVLLQTIPGVGPRTAETIVAYMDDPSRFSQARQVGAYFGLVPCQDASAAANRLGHITREGPPTARKLLVEATWQGIRQSESIRGYFERIVGGKPERRKIAVVATAHHLLRCMHAMLRTQQAWREAA
jgi:transposase